MDKEGILAAKMKIVLSRISGSGGDNIEEFMKKVDKDVSLMRTLPEGLKDGTNALCFNLVLPHVGRCIMQNIHPKKNCNWIISQRHSSLDYLDNDFTTVFVLGHFSMRRLYLRP